MTLFDLDEWTVKPEKEPATDLMKEVARKAPVKKKIQKDFTPEEAKEIKQAVDKARPDPNATEVEKLRAQERRKKIVRIKKLAKEMEIGNRSKVILFPSYSQKTDELKWYKMGEVSALYYAYRMADRMGRKGKTQRDTDKFSKMSWIVSINGIEKFLEQAMQLNEFERYEETLDGIYILYLKKPLTDEEVGILRRTEKERKEMMHNVLRPKNADAKVYQTILTLDRQLMPRLAKIQKGYYRTVGDKVAAATVELTEIYFCFADGLIDTARLKAEMLMRINKIRAGLSVLGENSVWGYDVATAIGENVALLRQMIIEMKGKK